MTNSILAYLDGSLIPLKKVFHLKTGLSYIENNKLLIAGEFIENPTFKNFNKKIVPENEAYSANFIWVNGHVLVPLDYPKTQKYIQIEELFVKLLFDF